MTNLINTTEQTMSSREIARLTGKRHQHVVRDIREITLQFADCQSQTKFGLAEYTFKRSNYLDKQGKERVEYQLNQKEVLLLVSGYNVVLRAAVINRWVELEKQQGILKVPAPKTINGVQCIAYNYWLLQNGYSLTSGQVRARIKKYPEQFIKTKDGWYMSEAIGRYFLDYRNPKEKIAKLPFVSPKQLSMFND
ncbi:Rha family transcriptional regulator [Capnocytophaga canis]|uniref:Rha family transcriptional regulator n=1 Tax=Capnocytophaga canis TaxID=1848903 RepID=UPI001561F332|nr:Rha family transcriptional regulator [Capnocytophaga canis]